MCPPMEFILFLHFYSNIDYVKILLQKKSSSLTVCLGWKEKLVHFIEEDLAAEVLWNSKEFTHGKNMLGTNPIVTLFRFFRPFILIAQAPTVFWKVTEIAQIFLLVFNGLLLLHSSLLQTYLG